MLYMININSGNNRIFSFSCSNNSFCGFFINENLIDFEENKYDKNQINTNNELGYILQNI